MRNLVGACALLMVLSPRAEAQRALALSGDLGLGALDGTAHTTVQSGVEVREGGLSLAVFGRVRLMWEGEDGEPELRRRDWDEVTDYLHILRELRYRRRFGELSLDLATGELRGFTLGQGTLIRDYSNIADPDHPHPGVRLSLAHPSFEVTAMVDNYVRPSVIAARVAARPLKAFAPLAKLVSATSLVIDPRAPKYVDSAAGRREIDGGFNLRSDDTVVVLIGSDLSYTFGTRQRGLTPYADFNSAIHGGPDQGGGVGLHLGLLGGLPLGEGRLRLSAQVEYHNSRGGYAPAWVQTFYDVDRFQSSLAFADPARSRPDQRATKLTAISTGAGGHGLLAQLGVEHGRLLRLKIGFSREPGPDANRLWIRASSVPVERLTLGALVVARGLGDRGADATGLAALAEARVRINDYFYALGQYTRTWALRDDTRYYGTLEAFNVGVGGNWND